MGAFLSGLACRRYLRLVSGELDDVSSSVDDILLEHSSDPVVSCPGLKLAMDEYPDVDAVVMGE